MLYRSRSIPTCSIDRDRFLHALQLKHLPACHHTTPAHARTHTHSLSLTHTHVTDGLFKCTEQELLFPNPQADSANPFAETIHHLKLFEFVGRMIGKAIYDGILIELRLAPFFLRKMLGKEMYFDDLESLDADLYKNLMWTKKYTGDYTDLALTFEVTENVMGSTVRCCWGEKI
jgi:hypothetical protein